MSLSITQVSDIGPWPSCFFLSSVLFKCYFFINPHRPPKKSKVFKKYSQLQAVLKCIGIKILVLLKIHKYRIPYDYRADKIFISPEPKARDELFWSTFVRCLSVVCRPSAICQHLACEHLYRPHYASKHHENLSECLSWWNLSQGWIWVMSDQKLGQ